MEASSPIFDSIVSVNGRTPDIWETASETVMYLGYAGPGTKGVATDQETFLIVKIVFDSADQTGGRKYYPNGLLSFSNAWDDRATLSYTFKR